MTLTPDQQQDGERLRAHGWAHGLVSVMNDTRWRRLRDAVIDLPVRLRRKDVRGPEPAARFDADLHHQLGGAAAIEWIELTTPHLEDLAKALGAVRVPFVRADDRLRVCGYTCPGADIDWAT